MYGVRVKHVKLDQWTKKDGAITHNAVNMAEKYRHKIQVYNGLYIARKIMEVVLLESNVESSNINHHLF